MLLLGGVMKWSTVTEGRGLFCAIAEHNTLKRRNQSYLHSAFMVLKPNYYEYCLDSLYHRSTHSYFCWYFDLLCFDFNLHFSPFNLLDVRNQNWCSSALASRCWICCTYGIKTGVFLLEFCSCACSRHAQFRVWGIFHLTHSGEVVRSPISSWIRDNITSSCLVCGWCRTTMSSFDPKLS